MYNIISVDLGFLYVINYDCFFIVVIVSFLSCCGFVGLGVDVNGYVVVVVLGNVIMLWIDVVLVISIIRWFRLNVRFVCGGVLKCSVLSKKLNLFFVFLLLMLRMLNIVDCMFLLWICIELLFNLILFNIIL